MGNDRARILAAVADACGERAAPEPYPEWDDALAVAAGRLQAEDLAAAFRRNFEAAAGRCCDDVAGLAAFLAARDARTGYCDPALRPALARRLPPEFRLVDGLERSALDRLDFAVTTASAAIAETGSLVLTDRDTSDRLAAVACWIHVAVLDPATIVAGIAEAVALTAGDPYTVFVTGPSQTADVEGILIRGVHGPGEQLCLWWPGWRAVAAEADGE